MSTQEETKIALVTGANKGIGYEIARQIGQSGAFVLIGARNAERGQAAARALAEEGHRGLLVAAGRHGCA